MKGSATAMPPPPAMPAISKPRVLIIDDEPVVAAALRATLDRAGMLTEIADSGAAAMALVWRFAPEIVLVDLTLPDTSGIDLIRWFRANYACGLIVVTGNEQEAERIVGLEIGADDYVNKPPAMRELVARVRALHRRVMARATPPPPPPPARPTTLLIGRVSIDLRLHRAADAAGRAIDVTAAEFATLRVLIEAGGQAVSREELSLRVLRRPWRAEDRSVDQLIFQLRNKITPADKDHAIIQTIRGAGYRLVVPA